MTPQKLICFDLEGPLSPQDNAYEVVALIPGGREIFEMISRYDDILALEGREGYEPGDTLALIIPFLIYHGITKEDIRRVSSRAEIVKGAGELVMHLKEDGWDVKIISTSYREHAYSIGSRIGISGEDIACTELNLEDIAAGMREETLSLIGDAVSELLGHRGDEDDMVKFLDRFFFKLLPDTGYGNPLERVRVIGGKRKVDAARMFAEGEGLKLGDIMVVGDSITDCRMLDCVRREGGIAVAFNANRYALPHANFALATLDMRFLDLLCEHFPDKEHMIETVQKWQQTRGIFEHDPGKIPTDLRTRLIDDLIDDLTDAGGFIAPYFHYLEGADDGLMEKVESVHARFREKVRGRASILG